MALTTTEKGSNGDTANAEKGKEGFMQAATSKALRPFVIISSSYLLFTITDGAIRMIVLLHAYNINNTFKNTWVFAGHSLSHHAPIAHA